MMILLKRSLIAVLAALIIGCSEQGYPDHVRVERINTSKLQALLVTPETLKQRRNDPIPAVIVLGGSGGGLNGASHTAIALAEKGVAALAVGYFGIKDRPAQLKEVAIEYLSHALRFIDETPEITRNRCDQVPVIGSSRGSELALLAGSTSADYAPIIAISPSSHIWGAVGDPAAPAWTYNGQPLPFVPRHSDPDYSVAEFTGHNYFMQDLQHPDAIPAQIKASDIKGQILLLAGNDDQLWPSAYMAQTLQDTIERAGTSTKVETIIYAGAGHVISPGLPSDLTQVRHPSGQTVLLGGSPEANAAAQADALRRIVQLIKAPLCLKQ